MSLLHPNKEILYSYASSVILVRIDRYGNAGVQRGLALAGRAYKAGRTVPTRECLPKLSARNHRHRCFRLLNLFVNIDGVKRCEKDTRSSRLMWIENILSKSWNIIP